MPDEKVAGYLRSEHQSLTDKVRGAIEEDILSGVFKPGEKIPTEPQLALRFGVSIGTVREAVRGLAERGELRREQGRGTFVASHVRGAHWNRFQRLQGADGHIFRFSSRLVSLEEASAPEDVCLQLNQPLGTVMPHAVRLLFDEREPDKGALGLDRIWLSPRAFHGVRREPFLRVEEALYSMYESEFGVTILEASDRVTVVPVAGSEARLLGCAPGTLFFHMARISRTFGRLPVEARRSFMRASRCRICVD